MNKKSKTDLTETQLATFTDNKAKNTLLFQGLTVDDFFNQLEERSRQIIREEISISKQKEFEEKLLSVDEARKVFQPIISRQTLNTWSKTGTLPARKIGGKNYYRYSDIIAAGKVLKLYKRN